MNKFFVVFLIGLGLTHADFLSDIKSFGSKVESKLTDFKDDALDAGASAYDFVVNNTEKLFKKAETYKPSSLSPSEILTNLTESVNEELNENFRPTRELNVTDETTDAAEEMETTVEVEVTEGIVKITQEITESTSVPMVTTPEPTVNEPMTPEHIQNDQPAVDEPEPAVRILETTETTTQMSNILKITTSTAAPKVESSTMMPSTTVSSTTIAGIKSGTQRPKDGKNGSGFISYSGVLISLCMTLLFLN